MHSWHDTRFLIQMTGHLFRKNTCGDGIMLTVYVLRFNLHMGARQIHISCGIYRQMVNMRISNTRILIKHLIVERICQFSKIQIQNFSHNNILLFVVGYVGSKPYRAFYRIHDIPRRVKK